MSQTPRITEMRVIPVAGYDSMLLNIGGAHHPCFTRNLVILRDNAGHEGVGEAPGGDTICKTLESFRELVLHKSLGQIRSMVHQAHTHHQAADFDTFGKGAWTFELRVNAVAALETALYDLLGQFMGVPMCDLLGPGRQRDAITVLGYLFYIGDSGKTDLPYAAPEKGHEWYSLRRREAMDTYSVVRLAEAARDRYGFNHFKLKGGVLPGPEEIETVHALHEACLLYTSDAADE